STGGAGAAGQGVPERAAPAGEPPEDEGSAGGTPGDGGGGLDAPADDPFAGAVVLAEPMEFTTPSGNISCTLDLGYARCDIVERDWEPPPPPEDCEVDFGQGVEVDDSGASLVCAGDTVLGAAQTLPYGEAVQGGRIACVSQRAGVRCEHLDTGAGFVLSRTSYDLY
ncbi:MAG: hypothetical protein M3P95_00240, partial [Actinomycetota bacterium]|nr:hypothetical protein [Actinomycetota bacterium]